jgi:hypothetical protein
VSVKAVDNVFRGGYEIEGECLVDPDIARQESRVSR